MSKQNGIKKVILQINVCDVVPRWAPSNDEGVVIVGCPMVRNFNWIVIPWKTFITEAYALRKMGCIVDSPWTVLHKDLAFPEEAILREETPLNVSCGNSANWS